MNLTWWILKPIGYGLYQMAQVFIKAPLWGDLWKKYIIIKSWCIGNIYPFLLPVDVTGDAYISEPFLYRSVQ